MKRLVVCCDGTWNRADQQQGGKPCPTNVWQTAFMTATRDAQPQVVLYAEGVGTGNLVDRLTGGAFGSGLEENVLHAYRFLVSNYDPGDELWLFGFSRGAFTARSLAGMIRKVGILKRASILEVKNAFDLYRDDAKDLDGSTAKVFRAAHAVLGDAPTPIHFIGVWDTVGSLGIPLSRLRWLTARRHRFHDTELSANVTHAYHALAIDEHRTTFSPTPWLYKPKQGQTVEQVWFPGCHSDVGGGYLDDDLSDVALAWMLEKATRAGLALDAEALASFAPDPKPLGKLHDSRTFVFRVLPGEDRRIGWMKDPETGQEGMDPTQSLHASALERWDKDPSYRPKNVRAYLRDIGDPRATT